MPCSAFLFFGKRSEPLNKQHFSLELIWATRPKTCDPNLPLPAHFFNPFLPQI